MRPPVRSPSEKDYSQDDENRFQSSVGSLFEAGVVSTTNLAKDNVDWNFDFRVVSSTDSQMTRKHCRKSADSSNNKSRTDNPSSNESLSISTFSEFAFIDNLEECYDERLNHPRLESDERKRSTPGKMESKSRQSLTSSNTGSCHTSTASLSNDESIRRIQSKPRMISSTSSSSNSKSAIRHVTPDLTSPSAAPTKPSRKSIHDRDHQPPTLSATTSQNRTGHSTRYTRSGSSSSMDASKVSISMSRRTVAEIDSKVPNTKPGRRSEDVKESRSGRRRSSNGGGVVDVRKSRRRASGASSEVSWPNDDHPSGNDKSDFRVTSSGSRRSNPTDSTRDDNLETKDSSAEPRQSLRARKDSEKELAIKPGQDRLKSSHLRRLVEPKQRLARNISQSSGFSGRRASISSTVSSLDNEQAIHSVSDPRFTRQLDSWEQSTSWRPPSSRTIFTDADNLGRRDSAPKSPLRRSSVATMPRRRSSLATSPRHRSSDTGMPRRPSSDITASRSSALRLSARTSKPSRETAEFNDPGDDVSASEKINEDDDQDLSSCSSGDELVLLEPDTIGEEDIFTCYSWSTSKQDHEKMQKERMRLRDCSRDTPLYRAYESSKRL